MTKCPHNPKKYLGLPIGQYHCPVCPAGCMVLAGMDHTVCDDDCSMQDDDDRARIKEAEDFLMQEQGDGA